MPLQMKYIGRLSSILLFIYILQDLQVLAQSKSKDLVPPGRTCLSHQLESKSTHWQNRLQLFEARMSASKKIRQSSRTEADTLILPVIVHVVHHGETVGVGPNISKDQIYSQLDVLNEDFNRKPNTRGYNNSTVGASLQVKFVPALIDPLGNALDEPGIHRIYSTSDGWGDVDEFETQIQRVYAFPARNYINIWVVKFKGNLSQTLGYATLPYLSTLTGAEDQDRPDYSDGLVIRYNAFGRTGAIVAPYNLGRTTTHEMGHFLGLRHIWGDELSCNSTDYCDDTPTTSGPFYGCPSSPVSCTTSQRAMVENYMEYTNDQCMNIFTQDQVDRMLIVLDHAERRKELTQSDVYLPNNKPKALFEVQKVACNNTLVQLSDKSTGSATAWAWTITHAGTNTLYTSSTLQNPLIAFTSTGTYHIQLTVTNSLGSSTTFKENALEVISSINAPLPVVSNFELGMGELTLLKNNNKISWKLNNIAGSIGSSGSLAVDNYFPSANTKGQQAEFVSPRINFASVTGGYLEFDVAYTSYDADQTDTLQVLVSNNCGASFSSLWKRGGAGLSTAPFSTDPFIPTSSQWRSEQISLQSLNQMSNLIFMFRNTSGWGNTLYVDHVKIHNPTVTSVPTSTFSVLPSKICPGSIVSFSDQSSQYPTSWNWEITNTSQSSSPITSNVQHPQVRFRIPGVYKVSLRAGNALGTGNISETSDALQVYATPNVQILAIDAPGTLSCDQDVTLSATGASLYYWYDSRSTFALADSTDAIQVPAGEQLTYQLIGYDDFGCMSVDTLSLKFDCITSSREIDGESSIGNHWILGPTPFQHTVAIVDNTPVPSIKVFNTLGNMVYESSIPSTFWHLGHLPSGVYTFVLKDKNGTLQKIKMVKMD